MDATLSGVNGKVRRFAAARPAFTREQFRRELFRGQPPGSADSLLRYHVAAGRFRRVGPGVYATVPAHLDPARFRPDPILVAALIRDDGIVAFHAAMELHGLAYSSASEIQVLSHGRPGTVATEVGPVRFVHPPAQLRRSGKEGLGVVLVDRRGLHLKVTGPERTLVDCLDRPALAGGLEEVAHALWTVEAVDVDLVLALVRARANRVLAGLVGWWLDRRAEDLLVGPGTLATLRELAPASPAPALGASPESGRLDANWRVWLPSEIAGQGFEDVPNEGLAF